MLENIASKRILSIDILRGMVMVVMALDHTRDYFSNYPFDPTDLHHPNIAMFFTRWITHFCAPVFVFLSGTSAFLSQGRGKTKKEATFQLFTRGLWLILIEVTVNRFGWFFNVNYSFAVLQVIWVLGCSMVFLSAMVWLPHPLILTIGLVIVFGHDSLDGIKSASLGNNSALWLLLHEQGPIKYGNSNVLFVFYPLIPWIGLMSLGYCFGAIFKMPEVIRNKWLYGIGIAAILLFIVIRSINIYGDPSIWQFQSKWQFTVLSFLNCSKYPPSLLYLLMTLGPAIILLPILEKWSGAVGSFFTIYGRVPFFYYILHIYLIHSVSCLLILLHQGERMKDFFMHPGFPISIVYTFWLFFVLSLYFPCRWFMRIKMTHKKWWLSYL